MKYKILGFFLGVLSFLSAGTLPSLYTFATTDYPAGLHLVRVLPNGELEYSETTPININNMLVRTLAIAPNDLKLYVPYLSTNGATNGIYVYDIDPVTGGATLNVGQSFTTAGTNANVLTNAAISSDGTSLYVTSGNTAGTSKILQYTIQSNGSLVAKSPATVATGVLPNDIIISPNGLFAYVSNRNTGGTATISQYAIDPTTGILTALSPASVNCLSDALNLAMSPDGLYLYVGSHDNGILQTFSVASNGQLTFKTQISTGASENRKGGLTISDDGKNLYYSGTFSSLILAYTRNITTGALTLLQTINFDSNYNPYFLVLSSDDKTLYATVPDTTNVNGKIFVYTRDTNTGILTEIQSFTTTTAGVTPPFRPMCLTKLEVVPPVDPVTQTELMIDSVKKFSSIKTTSTLFN